MVVVGLGVILAAATFFPFFCVEFENVLETLILQLDVFLVVGAFEMQIACWHRNFKSHLTCSS